MELPKVANEVEADEDALISFCPKVQRQIEELDERDQKKLSKGISHIYSKIMKEIMNLKIQSYCHISQIILINSLLNNKTPLLVSGFVITVEICPDSFRWHVCSISDKETAKKYRIHKIP